MSVNSQLAPVKIRLPHPYLTTYYLEPSSKSQVGNRLLQLRKAEEGEAQPFPHALHNNRVYFGAPQPVNPEIAVPASNNTAWARAQRSPSASCVWEGASTPTVGQIWLFLYAVFTVQQEIEAFRLQLQGSDAEALAHSLRLSMVAIDHPRPVNNATSFQPTHNELLIMRSAFWQGCASPLGSQPIWFPTWNATAAVPHLDYTITATETVHHRHPRRSPKPTPGSLVYSRYIPFLDEHFSLVALDYQNPEHLNLFHTWQNDPRVAQGWKETGTLEQHRDYLRRQHEDPHTLTVLGRFNDTPFSYYEVFWAKEDTIGAHYPSRNFDRGRHTLVGNDAFRGPHRVMAWWPSIIHYCFLDDHRTENIIGEPMSTNDKVHTYDYTFGLHQSQVIDLPHKRASLVKCTRERFFQLCPFNQGSPHIAGTGLAFKPRL
ncbi:hypothetical protein N7492_002104 [Penicillium capsulatum]|uniref:Acyltransferase MbtK/IucB-like conserved domain-containing protein n=1 Tax=Penicillium capsulatum TaxID=69766 RepID=A0A9W9IJG5_9EURO|nr:hypothetical protein N7492_002104 [Penicillium capsulatum]KAJ6123284.1 hypothetical protein N7512_005749 [Penicillium capsulatum]